jgi:hypothetical protein
MAFGRRWQRDRMLDYEISRQAKSDIGSVPAAEGCASGPGTRGVQSGPPELALPPVVMPGESDVNGREPANNERARPRRRSDPKRLRNEVEHLSRAPGCDATAHGRRPEPSLTPGRSARSLVALSDYK